MKSLFTLFLKKKLILLALVAPFTFLLLSCSALMTMPGEKQAPTSVDVADMTPGSLKLTVTDYTWNILGGGSHVSVQGNLVNESGGPIHGAMISAIIYDQNGNSFGFGDSYIRPTYLKEGAKASFEFVSLTNKAKGVTATRLVYSVRPQSGY
ncbi:MAG: FxLYD domain-containing protein [Deltaproteobacteria bacterium]|nr:FxLYD domain-containing protein [Deltaproteobacteria bacterium]